VTVNIRRPPRDSLTGETRVSPVPQRTRVLVVDDDREVREALADVLATNGYEAVLATNGDEALAIVDRDESIDLVLLDMNMPEPDGFDILRSLKAHDRRHDMPVICLSARSGVEDKVAGLKLGAADYLAKPFDIQELFARMARPLRVKRAIERLDRARTAAEHLSLTDPLTGLPNRRELERRLGEELDRSTRNQQPLGCLMLDVDRFKLINDLHGHGVGDLVLAEVARALLATLRSFDLVARYGGDEFAVLLPGADLEATSRVAEALRDVVATVTIAPRPGSEAVRAAISVGATFHDPSVVESASTLLDRADAALLDAKQAGRNRVVSRDEKT
jgi:diguanylate cyclase (GGDEF)-like protein